MDNKFFMVYVEGESTQTLKHTSKESAEKEAQRLANKLSKKAFVLETDSMSTPDDINIKVDSYKAALKYLGKSFVPVTCSDFNMIGVSDKHTRAITAICQLITIAEAWNKVDEFVPDFTNIRQYKWYPWFDITLGGVACVSASYDSSHTHAPYGSRLAFKTKERAEQFGKQFIDLWNDFLL